MSAPQIKGWLPFAAAALAFAAGLVIAGMALLGGSVPDRAAAAVARPALQPVGSCHRLRSYLAKHSQALRVSGAGSLPGGVIADGVAAPSAAEAAPPSGSATNVQEPGVDEPDIVKASGSVIFTVDGDRLRAIDTGEAPVPRRLAAPAAGPGHAASVGDYQLLVAGDRLLAIGSSYGYAAYEGDVASSRPTSPTRGAAHGARRNRRLRPRLPAPDPDDDARRLVREREAHRLDRAPGELGLSVAGGRRPWPRARPAAAGDDSRPGRGQAPPRVARAPAPTSAGPPASPAASSSPC